MDWIIFSIIIVCFTCSTLLFYKAAGTLNPGKINIISYIYYLFMLQTFAGIALIMLGFDKHYTLDVLINRSKACEITFIVVMVVSIFLPLFIVGCEKIFHIKSKEKYETYLQTPTEKIEGVLPFTMVCLGSVLCLALLLLFLMKIGYIPLLKLVTASSEFEFALERGRLAEVYIINSYVTNIFIHGLIPLLSYVTFAYAIVTRTKKWYLLGGVMFAAAIVVKTYQFAKSPLIFHLFVYLLIVMYLKGGIKKRWMFLFGTVMAGVIVLFYFSTGFHGTLLDIYNGPMGRTLFTQVGTLSYVFDLFPTVFPFLAGRSQAPTILKLLGSDSAMHLRSGKLAMAYYGSERVYDGGAGVMNTVFFGEAYANHGYWGIAFSLVWVALIITLIFWIVLKLKKTPFTVTFLAVMVMRIGNISQGGFYDFLYNFDLILTAVILLGGHYFLEKDGRVQRKLASCVESIGEKICRKS